MHSVADNGLILSTGATSLFIIVDYWFSNPLLCGSIHFSK
jgi:hypothetical protein